jgi:hypothetical protein
MTPTLSDDQRNAIEEHGGTPVYLVDAATNVRYVLMRADQYEKVKALFEPDDIDPREAYPLADEVMKEDWDDPAMDVYNDYDAHRPRQP